MEPAKLFKKFRIMNTMDYAVLTVREKEIVELVNNGLTCKQIADKTHRSEETISKHYSNIKKKVGFCFIKLACMYVAQLGLFQVFIFFCSIYIDDSGLIDWYAGL